MDHEQQQQLKKVEKKAGFITNVTLGIFQSLFVFVIVILLFLGALGAGIGAGYFASLVADTSLMERDDFDRAFGNITETSYLNYADGSQIATISSDLLRTTVSSEEISTLLKDAIVSVEDENFYEHSGFVPKAVLRALISEVTGLGSSGGSTLTQQLIKQQVLTDETTFDRKANEILLAAQAEKFYTKDEIVTTYLNVSPFGRNNRGQNIAGVQEAAEGIFGVSAAEVNLAQAAFIAGLPQSPIVYSPYTQGGALKEDYSAGLERKDEVLFAMYREGLISEADYNDAKNYDLAADFLPQATAETDDRDFLYYSVMDEAINVLAEQLALNDGLSETDYQESTNMNQYLTRAERQIENNGYTVTSTIDQSLYDSMQQAAVDYGYMLQDGSGNEVQTGTVMMDNTTGKILAFLGSLDYSTNQNNHALTTQRQPGSTIKPVLAYGPAVDQGLIGTESKIASYEVKYKTIDQPIENANGVSGVGNFLSTRAALQASDNVTAYHTYQEIQDTLGANYVYENYLSKMNFPDNGDWNTESAPLGTSIVTVLDMVNSYQTLANGGNYLEGYLVENIVDNAGNVIYQHQADPVQVYSQSAASIMNNLMESVITAAQTTSFKGILTGLNSPIGQADWAGKTGTTEDNTDSWLIVQTPAITIGNWSGKDDNSALYGYSGVRSGNFLAYMVNRLYQTNSTVFGADQKFSLSSDVQSVQVSDVTGLRKGNFTYENKSYSDPGSLVTSLWASGATIANSRYNFGIGGTTENYQSYWAQHNASSTTSSSDSRSSGSNSNNSATTDNDSDDADSDNDTGTDNNNTDEETPADDTITEGNNTE
ncbi:transglycosylase domain-containing protein [Enterococcus sp. LJL120]